MREPLESSPALYFVLVFLLTLPFWVVGGMLDLELMPGLPLSSLMVVAPALAAFSIRWNSLGRSHAIGFLARAVDIARLRSPAIVVLLLLMNPLIYAASYFIQTAFGAELPLPDVRTGQLFGLLAIFLVAAVLEELGWTGHATDLLRKRRNILQTGLMLGVVCALWHVVPLLQVGRSLEWILWWAVGTVAARVLMVWFYERTGRSVFILSVYHAISNTCWQLYPVQGSLYDPRFNAAITVLFVLVVVRPWKSPYRGSESQ